MKPSKFQVGDVVKMGSGSYLMTVSELLPAEVPEDDNFVICKWFIPKEAGGWYRDLQEAELPEDSLQLVRRS